MSEQLLIPTDTMPSRTICRERNCFISGPPESPAHEFLSVATAHICESFTWKLCRHSSLSQSVRLTSRLAGNSFTSIVIPQPVTVNSSFTAGFSIRLPAKGRQMGFILGPNCIGLSRRIRAMSWLLRKPRRTYSLCDITFSMPYS